MLWILISIGILVILTVFEFRIKKPDQLILSEKNNQVTLKKGKIYPRHFNLAISTTSYSFNQKILCDTRGHLAVEAKIAATIAVSNKNIANFVRIGGWDSKAVSKIGKELEVIIHGIVKEFIAKFEIDEVSSDKTYDYIKTKLTDISTNLGIDILSLSVQSVDTVDKEIADALRKKEEARIKEASEKSIQDARIYTTKLKIEADEKIMLAEHELNLKKLQLQSDREEKEQELSFKRIEEEIKRKKAELEIEKQELELLKQNPELLILSPQIARLAEASQSLKNAKTVVNISPGELDKVNEVTGVVQSFFQNVIQKYSEKNN